MYEPYFSFLKQGLLIGLAVSAPVGPTSIFLMQKSLTKGIVSGFVSSAGAATAQMIYAGVGALSLNLVESSLVDYKSWFNLISGVFLFYLGIKIFLNHPILNQPGITPMPGSLCRNNILLGDYSAAFFLNSVNPLTILPFVAFFAQIYSKSIYINHIYTGVFASGVFISSVLWYGLIIAIAIFFSRRILLRRLHWVNRISGTAIAIFGCASIYSAWN